MTLNHKYNPEHPEDAPFNAEPEIRWKLITEEDKQEAAENLAALIEASRDKLEN